MNKLPPELLTRRECLAATLLAAGAWSLAARAASAPAAQKGRLGVRASPWFTTLEGHRLRCELCPRHCQLPPGRRGACRVRENRRGVGHTLVYGNPALLQVDPIERKPFYHVRPGSRSLSVATAGCNFSCKFCEVWDLALVAAEEVFAFEISPAEAVRIAREAGAESLAFSYGEAATCFEYLLDTARAARAAGLLALMHSNGFLNPAPLAELAATLNAAQIDLKSLDEDFYRKICGGELAPVLDNLRRLRARGVHLEITHLLIPTLTDGPDAVRALCRWIHAELGSATPLHLARFYPLYQLANLPPTPISALERAYEIARETGLEYVYVANVPGHPAQHTRCPACGETLIERLGFVVEANRLRAGACPHCRHPIPGLWNS